MLTKTITKSR